MGLFEMITKAEVKHKYFTFKYNRVLYAVMKETATADKKLCCYALKKKLLSYICDPQKPVSADALEIAYLILKSSENTPRDYPMRGEHYIVRDGDDCDYRVAASRTGRYKSVWHKSEKPEKNLSITLTATASYMTAWIVIRLGNIKCMSAIFPDMNKYLASALMLAFVLLGTFAMYIINKERNDECLLALDAVTPINIISLTAAVITGNKENIYIISAIMAVTLLTVVYYLFADNTKLKNTRKRLPPIHNKYMYAIYINMIVVSLVTIC